MLKSIKIRNYKIIEDFSLDLPGSYVIEGHNMTGKTTTLDAVHWAVTGKTLDGSNDTSALVRSGVEEVNTRVILEFDNFTLERGLTQESPEDAISSYVRINGELMDTLKKAEAQINAKLGLTDIILIQPKGFEIKSFLLNPLYFDTLAPSLLRKFFYKMADVDLKTIFEEQPKPIQEAMIEVKEGEIDPYILLELIASEQKENKKKLDALNLVAKLLQPTEEMGNLIQELGRRNIQLDANATLIKKYALEVNKALNKVYEEHDIKLCLIEAGEKGYKEVCYVTNCLFSYDQCSYAEKTLVATAFVTMFAKKFMIAPLPLLLDNLESLDKFSTIMLNNHLEENKLQMLGAKVI